MTTGLAIAIVALLAPGLAFGKLSAVGVLVAVALIIAAGPPAALALCRVIEARWERPLWIYAKLSEVIQVMVRSMFDAGFVLKIFTSGLILFAISGAILFLLFLSLQTRLDLASLALFCALNLLSTYVNITPGNLGVQEVAYGILSETVGVGMGTGILVSALLRLFGLAVVLLVAIPLGGADLLWKRKEYLEESQSGLAPLA